MRSIIIKILSDYSNIDAIESVLNQLKIKGYPVEISRQKDIEFNNDHFFIFYINDVKSKFLMAFNDYLRNQDKFDKPASGKTFFATSENNALLVNTLHRSGYLNIFYMPDESEDFIRSLQKSFIGANEESNKNDELNSATFNSIIGESESLQRTINIAKKISVNSSSNILIRGETGTGKGLLARVIHNSGQMQIDDNTKTGSAIDKAKGRFVEIMCSSLPEELLESELFGYEEGAFTNAQIRKQGLFELAENGTLLLDEVGDLTMNIQSKLLRAIEKKMIRRLGSVNDTAINARIIASTNMNLEELIEQNKFRQDLFHRLNVVSFELPPLRNRGNDILILARHFIEEYSVLFNKKITGISKEVEELFLNYFWPGNVRELKNAVERATLLSSSGKKTNKIMLEIQDFTELFHWDPAVKDSDYINENYAVSPTSINLHVDFTKTSLAAVEKIYAKKMLDKMNGNKTKAAKLLGISRPKLDSLLK